MGESGIQESVKLIFGFPHFKPERIARRFRLEGLREEFLNIYNIGW
jgi:hypothetical protein